MADTSAPPGPRHIVGTVEDLVSRARALVVDGGRTVLGIVGAPGAGKTTVSDALAEALGDRVAVVGMDGFHLDDRVLHALARRNRKGAPDTFDVAGYVALLRRLRDRTDDVVYAPVFDRSIEASFGSAVPVPRGVGLVVTEGIYLLHDTDGWDAVRAQLDEVWFLDVPPAERRRRLVARRMADGDDAAAALAWVTGVDEPNGRLVDATMPRADLVVRLQPTPTEEQ